MLKKTLVALGVATVSAGAVALPLAASRADTPVQIAACNPCAAAAKKPANPCSPCAAANPCAATNPCAAAASPCAASPCAAAVKKPVNPCSPCAASNPCAAKSN